MERRVRGLYERVFEFLRDSIKMSPAKFICDFEYALRSAAKRVWSSIIISGCWFHHCQCLKRKKNSLPALSKLIRRNNKAKVIYQMFLKIPLLPENQMRAAFEIIIRLQKQHNFVKRFASFNTYYALQWLQKMDKKSYNVYKSDHRTNNCAEGFNSKLKRIIPRNPSTFTFLRKFWLLVSYIKLKLISSIFLFS